MEQERLAILRMLGEGKITADEAAALLDALEAKPASPASNFTEGLAGLAGRVASWGAEFGAKVAEEIHEGRVPALTWIGEYFDGRESVTERSGRFDRDEVEVECTCEAGSFSLRGGDGDGYALTVRQRFGQDVGPAIEANGGRLFVRGSGIVRGDLVLPREKRYRLRLRSSAGRIDLGDLAVSEATVTTEAGSIRLADLRGDSLAVNTSDRKSVV